VSLCDAARTASAKWKPIISALLNLGESMKISPRVFGALLWEHTTGLPYLNAQSDLDLIWSISDEQTARLLVEGLRRLDAESPVRLDVELQLPDGAGVNPCVQQYRTPENPTVETDSVAGHIGFELRCAK
jgi:phosphoribosyl-dephospho-CoA transferase